MKKILVATDFSENAVHLVHYIEDLNSCGVLDVVLMHVLEEESNKKVAKQEQDKAMVALENTRSYLEDKGYNVSISLGWGDPENEIVEAALYEKADMIVISSSDTQYLKRALLGSTTVELISNSHLPVLIEKGNLKKVAIDKCAHFRKIMIPTDFSLVSLESLNMVKNMRERIGEVVFSHVVEGRKSEEEIEETEQAKLKLAELVDEMSDFGIKASYHVSVAPLASKEVLSLCEEHDCSMIILPKIGNSIVKNFFMGSTAQNIIFNADIPIMMMPTDVEK